MLLLPLTVTVAVCVPADRSIFGFTVKLAVSPTAKPEKSTSRTKLFELVPLNAIVNSPVGWLPVLVTVTVCAVCSS